MALGHVSRILERHCLIIELENLKVVEAMFVEEGVCVCVCACGGDMVVVAAGECV